VAIETKGLARSFRYEVRIEDFGSIGFNSVSGIGDESEGIEYREGDDSDVLHEYDGLMSINEVDLEKGVATGDRQDLIDLYKWRYAGSVGENVVTVNGSPINVGDTSENVEDRRWVEVISKDENNRPMTGYKLKACSCRALEVSDFDAESSDILISTFTIKPEGMDIALMGFNDNTEL
jgi:phage tail-like protein